MLIGLSVLAIVVITTPLATAAVSDAFTGGGDSYSGGGSSGGSKSLPDVCVRTDATCSPQHDSWAYVRWEPSSNFEVCVKTESWFLC
jgi:hypothetical protein